tara:strand:- start:2614 stop:4047 length:1434 start_codon:yes stop_codon:yes gene_type:complete
LNKIRSQLKNYIYHGLVYGFGSAFDSIVGFMVLPLYTLHFSLEEYGIFSFLILISTFASSVFYLGATSALTRSYFDYDDLEERKKVASTGLYITLFGAMFQIFFGLIFSEDLSILLFKTPIYKIHILLILISSALLFIKQFFYLLLRLLMMSVKIVFVSISSSIIFLLTLWFLLVKQNFGILSPIIAFILSHAISTIILLFFSKNHLSIYPNKKEFKIQIMFGVPQILGGFSFYILDWIDRFFINEYLTLSDVGVYSFGYKISMLINIIFVFPVAKVWATVRSEKLNDNIEYLSSKMLTYYYLFGSLLSLFVIIFIKEFFFILSKNMEYNEAQYIVPFIIFAHLIYGMINIIDIGFFKDRKPMRKSIILLAHIPINILLNLILVPKFGYYGAAIATLFTYLLLILSITFSSNMLYKVKYERLNLFIISFVSMITVFLSMKIIDNDSLLSLNKFLIFTLLLVFYWYYFKEDIKKIISL